MAERKPLALDGGAVAELGSGDTLPVANVPVVVASQTHAASSKATPVDADEVPLVDSAASNALKRLTWASLKAAVLAWAVSQANTWAALQTFLDIRETMVTANTGTAYTVNTASGTLFDLTLTGNCVFAFSGGQQFTLLLRQDGTGSRSVTWPSSVRWPGGTAPTITATAGRTDVVSFLSDGTYWLGFVGGQDYNRA